MKRFLLIMILALMPMAVFAQVESPPSDAELLVIGAE